MQLDSSYRRLGADKRRISSTDASQEGTLTMAHGVGSSSISDFAVSMAKLGVSSRVAMRTSILSDEDETFYMEGVDDSRSRMYHHQCCLKENTRTSSQTDALPAVSGTSGIDSAGISCSPQSMRLSVDCPTIISPFHVDGQAHLALGAASMVERSLLSMPGSHQTPFSPTCAAYAREVLPWLKNAMGTAMQSVDKPGDPHDYDMVGLAGRCILNAAQAAAEVQPVVSGESTSTTFPSTWRDDDDASFGFHVLVVDHDPLAHMLIQKVLCKAGISATCVPTGEAALAVLSEAHALIKKTNASSPYDNVRHCGIVTGFPDAVILDTNFPDGCMNGIDTVKEIRRRFPRAPVPIIAHTTEQHPRDLMKLLDAGFSDYVSKKSTGSDLLARICVQVKTAATHRHLSRLEKGDAILQDILPAQVVGQLLEKGHVEPEHLGEVSVLFADIVGFTEMSSRLQTTCMIKVLNKLFSAFDKLASRLGVFKVETIGDCYMCVAGHDLATKKDHARLMVQMGLAMIDEAQNVLLPDGQESVSIRVGIHTGPVYAGVVGLSKPRYCLFGDTVNVASRMETTSKPGQLHVSEATYISCFPSASNEANHDEAGESIICKATGRAAADAAADNDRTDLSKISTTWFSAADYCEIKGKGLMQTRFCKRQSQPYQCCARLQEGTVRAESDSNSNTPTQLFLLDDI